MTTKWLFGAPVRSQTRENSRGDNLESSAFKGHDFKISVTKPKRRKNERLVPSGIV